MAESKPRITRRRFVGQALAVTSAAALSRFVPRAFAESKPCATETLKKIGEIASHKGRLKGIIRIKNAPKALPGYKGSQLPMMRYFEGIDQQKVGSPVWPPDPSACLPGPTLRVGVGEQVQITFLNEVDVGAFSGGTLDRAEQGLGTGCDSAVNAVLTPPKKDWYPGERGDSFPNCFHGSSTANLHFHGTHITPDGFGDNVLVQVRPDPHIDEEKVRKVFDEVFAACEEHGNTMPWKLVPESYTKWQEAAVADYDLHAIWKGDRGPIKDPSGKEIPALPVDNQLAVANEKLTSRDLWPEYFIGAFPNCFRVTPAEGHAMGQAPGTHWYHSHKHGSTAINLYNGLSGALIIEGDYDKDLEKIYPNLKKTEKVLIVQIFEDQPDLERAANGRGAPKAIMTNGTQVIPAVKADSTKTPPVAAVPQSAPAIVMRPGEVQLWRIINAQVQNALNNAAFSGPAGEAVSPLPQFRQIAQDGVQFNLHNYQGQPLTRPDKDGNGTRFSLVAGGRIDILVKAPSLPAGTTKSYELSGIANLTVCGDPVNDPWPDDKTYPTFPAFLPNSLPRPHKPVREVTFDWEPFRIATGAANPKAGNTHSRDLPLEVKVGNDEVGYKVITIRENFGPYFMIDDEQFTEGRYQQTLVLDDLEEWKVYNNTSLVHPFHIHINPFQVVEVFDPNDSSNSYIREENGVWQDVVGIPAAKVSNRKLVINDAGKAQTPGYVRFRTKYVDFTGSFVLHCHILAHEDRGMMQLVRVIDSKTPIRHH